MICSSPKESSSAHLPTSQPQPQKSIKHFGKLEGKVGAAFASCGGLGGGGETAILDILRAFLVHGMIVPGFTSGGHYGPLSVGSPDDERKKICREFGANFARIVKKVHGSG